MKLKKMLALFLALTMSMALAACSPAEEDTQPPSAEPSDYGTQRGAKSECAA